MTKNSEFKFLPPTGPAAVKHFSTFWEYSHLRLRHRRGPPLTGARILWYPLTIANVDNGYHNIRYPLTIANVDNRICEGGSSVFIETNARSGDYSAHPPRCRAHLLDARHSQVH